jgi:hypothetical protein
MSIDCHVKGSERRHNQRKEDTESVGRKISQENLERKKN